MTPDADDDLAACPYCAAGACEPCADDCRLRDALRTAATPHFTDDPDSPEETAP